MNDNLNPIYEEAAIKWQTKKGNGIVVLCEPLDRIKFLTLIIDKMISKNPNLTAWIIVRDMNLRMNTVYALENTSEQSEKIAVAITEGRITIFTRDYAEKYKYADNFKRDIIITLDVSIFKSINNIKDKFTFKLAIIEDTPNIPSNATEMCNFAETVYKISSAQLQHLSVNSPVKEIQIPCELTEDDAVQYAKYTKYINDTVTIFGNFDTIEECKYGNSAANISAEEVRRNIAESNGWSPYMDMNDPMSKSIDEMYNPNALADRAHKVYDIMRARLELIGDNQVKLNEIFKIVNDNKDKKILIVSRSSEFAQAIVEYINANIEYTGKSVPIQGEIFNSKIDFIRYPYACGFHSKMPHVSKLDDNGKPKLYASGDKKGQPIYMGEKAQKTQYLRLFEERYINVLSSNNSVDKTFYGTIDILILTSSVCSSVRDIKYRLPNLIFNSVPNIVYKVYCKNTTEQIKLEKEVRGKGDEIVKNCENEFIIGDI